MQLLSIIIIRQEGENLTATGEVVEEELGMLGSCESVELPPCLFCSLPLIHNVVS